MIQEEGKHYLYRHIRIDTNEIFYVGIGTKYFKNTGSKIYQRAFTTHNRSMFWKNIMLKTKWFAEILLESDDYEFIKQKEKEFIALYGRRDLGTGTLCNLTDGGEGVANRVLTEELRLKYRNGNKGKRMSEKNKKQMSLSKMGLGNPMFRKTEDLHHNAKPVYQYDINNNFIATYSCLKTAARLLGYSYNNLSRCCLGKQKLSKGFKWSYIPLV